MTFAISVAETGDCRPYEATKGSHIADYRYHLDIMAPDVMARIVNAM